MAYKNPNTFSANSDSETKLPDFGTLKHFDIKPWKKFSNKKAIQKTNVNQVHFEQTEG